MPRGGHGPKKFRGDEQPDRPASVILLLWISTSLGLVTDGIVTWILAELLDVFCEMTICGRN